MIQVIEYDRGEARIQQTTELRDDHRDLFVRLRVPMPARVHALAQVPAPRSTP
jgi:hypothetical protein